MKMVKGLVSDLKVFVEPLKRSILLQKMALEALHAVVRSTPEIDIAIRRQILWGLWALSTDDDRYLGNIVDIRGM